VRKKERNIETRKLDRQKKRKELRKKSRKKKHRKKTWREVGKEGVPVFAAHPMAQET